MCLRTSSSSRPRNGEYRISPRSLQVSAPKFQLPHLCFLIRRRAKMLQPALAVGVSLSLAPCLRVPSRRRPDRRWWPQHHSATLNSFVGRPTALPPSASSSHVRLQWPGPARDGTRRCGCGFGENPSAGKPAGWKNPPASKTAGAFLHPHPHPRISDGFRVPAGLTTDIIKIYKFINLNSQTIPFYK